MFLTNKQNTKQVLAMKEVVKSHHYGDGSNKSLEKLWPINDMVDDLIATKWLRKILRTYRKQDLLYIEEKHFAIWDSESKIDLTDRIQFISPLINCVIFMLPYNNNSFNQNATITPAFLSGNPTNPPLNFLYSVQKIVIALRAYHVSEQAI